MTEKINKLLDCEIIWVLIAGIIGACLYTFFSIGDVKKDISTIQSQIVEISENQKNFITK